MQEPQVEVDVADSNKIDYYYLIEHAPNLFVQRVVQRPEMHSSVLPLGPRVEKDSTVLAHTLKTLNDRYSYGLDLFLLSIDEGISGYRDDSLETVKRNRDTYKLPLKILSYEDLYGWTMDRIVQEVGRKNNCTFCGVFRRQALDRGAAALLKVNKNSNGSQCRRHS
ncbi:CTU1 [Lepeophtheirus salmonis]|uniref:CTU1 n=1 Tax=Lepeophtheirus salmonis TaxID=72036 RepID=A0A7R8H7E3_LEPSM|nr:CTU1 [Lepeophtheirus salmonis]CAF2906654.1 CTU1 [Lepeophtheirus salmonis]